MDEHLINEVESAFPTDNICTSTTYQRLPFGLVFWTVKVHSPSDWNQSAAWDRGITLGYGRAFKAAYAAEHDYRMSVRQQRDLMWEVADEDDGEVW